MKGKSTNKSSSKKISPVIKRKKARVHRILKDKESKLIENNKKLLVLRGNKTNEDINALLKDIKSLKAPDAKLFSKKNDIHVFDDENTLEFLTSKNDSSLFVIGSSTKKRPNNLVFGRTFDGHILDIIEFGLTNCLTIEQIKSNSKKAPGSKPCFIFSGDEWESKENFKIAKNMFLDIFRGHIVSTINLKGLDHVIVCTASDETILFRTYSIGFRKADDKLPHIELTEMGPQMDLTFRRTRFATKELMKIACKKPKGLVPTKIKNVTRDALTGDKMGKVYISKQDLYSMQTRHVKVLRKSNREMKENQGNKEKDMIESIKTE